MEIKKVGVAGLGVAGVQICAQTGYCTIARDRAGLAGSWSDAARRDSAPQRERQHAHRSRSAVARNNLHGIAVANLADGDLSHLYDLQLHNLEPRTQNLEPRTQNQAPKLPPRLSQPRQKSAEVRGRGCLEGRGEGLKGRIYL